MAVLYNIDGKNILFVHIPKTGGGSIDKTLSPHSRKDKVPKGGQANIIQGHPGIHECNMTVKADYTFSVIRNPWDLRASWYYYVRGNPVSEHGHKYEYDIIKNMSFKEHLLWLNNEHIDNMTNSIYGGVSSRLFIKQQSAYINPDVKILRLENLKTDFDNYMLELGLDIELNTHFRKSGNNNYINEYDSDTIEIVRKIHNDDIIKFGYNFK
tara:strand:+ start:14193 stop:14825 length:633 start_codon:yes stop_codon:yes gene_type:complete